MRFNSTCFENFSNISSNNEESLDKIYTVISYTYIIPSLSVASIIISMIIILCWCSLKLKTNTYKLILMRTISIILMSLINMGVQDESCLTCRSKVFTTYFNNFYRLYITRFCYLALSMAILFFEIFLLNDRICILRNKQSIISKSLKLKYQCLISFVLPIVVYSPDLFAYYVQYDCNDVYSRKFTLFGESIYFFYYDKLILIFQSFTLAIYIIFTLKCSILYTKFVQSKMKHTKRKQKNMSLNNLVLFLAFTCLILYSMYLALVVFDLFFANLWDIRNVLKYSIYIFCQMSILIGQLIIFYFDRQLSKALKLRLINLIKCFK